MIGGNYQVVTGALTTLHCRPSRFGVSHIHVAFALPDVTHLTIREAEVFTGAREPADRARVPWGLVGALGLPPRLVEMTCVVMKRRSEAFQEILPGVDAECLGPRFAAWVRNVIVRAVAGNRDEEQEIVTLRKVRVEWRVNWTVQWLGEEGWYRLVEGWGPVVKATSKERVWRTRGPWKEMDEVRDEFPAVQVEVLEEIYAL
jgi:hypothetical protein